MDQASVEASFSLHPFQSTQTVSGTFTWSDDGAGFRFTPDANLSLATHYVAEFTGDLPLPEGGGAALSGQTEWGFSTVPAPSIVGTDPGNGETGVYPYGGFRIYFASPMNPDTLKDHVQISPEPANSFDTYYSDYDNSYSLSFPTDPSTDYTVTITPGMADVYGNTISGQTVVHFTTAPSDPAVNLQVPGDIGFYNAYNHADAVVPDPPERQRDRLVALQRGAERFHQRADGRYFLLPGIDHPDRVEQPTAHVVDPERRAGEHASLRAAQPRQQQC